MSLVRKWWRRRPAARTIAGQSEVLAVRGLAPRRVTVYLPPGYDATRARPYPLLLALDGQTMPQWRLAETLDELTAAGTIEPAVVAAVPASAERMDEYGMAGQPDFAGRGRHAKALQDLLAGEVLPWLRASHHVAVDAAHTGIFGASLGGLCAFDTAWRRPQVFGLAGIFSGSLWWRADDSSAAAQQASRLAHRMVRDTVTRPALRLWFQAGTRDEAADRDGNGVIDAIQDTTELVDELVAKGFSRGREVVYHETEGGEHHEGTWARALPEFLRWALPPRVSR
ncbi:MAG TPA: alpha/beta hydrolase-fold protein [Lacunisphaera sp.]